MTDSGHTKSLTRTREASTVLVTGAASGIGAAIAAELAEAGWRVAGFDLRPSRTELSCTGDVTDLAEMTAAVAHATRELGPLDALVAAAGLYEAVPFEKIAADQWRHMLDVHLGGLVNSTRAVLPGMIGRHSGHIVAISSELATAGGAEEAHYAAAKGAMVGMIRSLAAEVAGAGVHVNSVSPGPTDTPLLPPDSPWREAGYVSRLPTGRLVRPDEIAATVRFLLTEGSFLVGEVISVNSGAVT